MKIKEHPVLKRIDDNSTHKTAITVDFSDDLIENTENFLKLIYELKTHYIPEPLGVWINTNQAYALCRENMNFIEPETKVAELVAGFDTFMSFRIWIKGRDA